MTALISAALRRPIRALGLTALPALLGFALLPTLGQQFFPPADRNQFEIQVRLAPGTPCSGLPTQSSAWRRSFEPNLRSNASIGASVTATRRSTPT